MLAFVLRRLVQAVIVMLTVAFIAFMLFQYVGDPVTNLLGQDATPEQRTQLRKDLGLDQPFPVQFAHFVGNAVQGEFGLSLKLGRKVSYLIAERLPATLELALSAGVIALVFAIPMRVMRPEDLLVTKLCAMTEHTVNYRSCLEIARALREQIDWQDVRRRSGHSPFARAFFTLVEGLEIADTAAAHD